MHKKSERYEDLENLINRVSSMIRILRIMEMSFKWLHRLNNHTVDTESKSTTETDNLQDLKGKAKSNYCNPYLYTLRALNVFYVMIHIVILRLQKPHLPQSL